MTISIRLFKWELRLARIVEPVVYTPEQRIFIACDELTKAWEECYLNRSGLKPWIDWQDKTVYVAKHGEPVKAPFPLKENKS